MNKAYQDGGNWESGLSTIAIIVLAAVVIGGGAILATTGSNTEVDTDADATTTADVAAESNTAVFACADGAEVVADFSQDGEATVTLPSGEVKTVSKVRAASGAKYASADGAFTFWNKGDEVTIQQDGEATLEGCVLSESEKDGEATEAEAGATSSTDVEVSDDEEASLELEADVEAGAGN
jgi:membrane-bound inhibitor of C-type lysozyme